MQIAGPAGMLEAVLEDPGGASRSYAVICHPHPLFGGTMDNKVVTSLARALHDCGIPTLRFNFRGVGSSVGTHDAGVGEIADADAVAGWGAARWPGASLVIAGFSFGGYIALRLSLVRQTAQLVTVAPAAERFEPILIRPDCAWLIIQGDADDVLDPNWVIAWAKAFQPPPNLVVLPGVGHFFHGRLHELRDAVCVAVRDAGRATLIDSDRSG